MMDISSLNASQMVGLRLLLAVAMASLGAALATRFKKISHFWLCVLISFAAGALLAVSLFEILPETVEQVGLWRALASFASGYFLFYVVNRFIFHVCPACAATHTETDFKAITIMMIAAMSIHSFMDGLAIYSSFAGGAKGGVLILLAVAYHKFPEGMALTLVARSQGLGRLQAFFIAIGLESVTTIAGGLTGLFFLLPAASSWMAYVLGHVGGGFVFLVFHALLGEALRHHPRSTIVATAAGALSIGLVCLF